MTMQQHQQLKASSLL
jgi:hypothetical protein